MIKAKIAKNKVVRKALIVNLFKSNKITTTKKIINMHKCKNYKCINENKEKCYLNDNKHYKCYEPKLGTAWYINYNATCSTKYDCLHVRRLDERTMFDMFNSELDE